MSQKHGRKKVVFGVVLGFPLVYHVLKVNDRAFLKQLVRRGSLLESLTKQGMCLACNELPWYDVNKNTDLIWFKLDSYSNAKRFFVVIPHAYFRIGGHERLFDTSISKLYPSKSDAAPWVEKINFKTQAFHAHDTGVLLFVWKRPARAIYRWAVVWGLNENTAAYH